MAIDLGRAPDLHKTATKPAFSRLIPGRRPWRFSGASC